MTGKLPHPDLDKIAAHDPVLVDRPDPFWRIHPATGPHPLVWNALRTVGPVDARFDPWPGDVKAPEPQVGGVGYFAFTWAACLAEVYQITRTIDLTRPGRQISGFEPARPLQLLDLTDTYAIRVGASNKIASGPRNICREWAVALTTVHPDLDGMVFTGMANQDCVVLFGPAADVFPQQPSFSKALDDRLIRSRVGDAAQEIGYRLLVT